MVSAMFVGFALCAVALPAVWSSDEKRRRDARKVLRILVGRDHSKSADRNRRRR
jgi:hypothetical protein